MQLFRHYLANNAEYSEIMIDNLRNFGFTLKDGKTLPPVEVWQDPNNTELTPTPAIGYQTTVALCWKNEKLNNSRYILQKVLNTNQQGYVSGITNSLGYYFVISNPSVSGTTDRRIFDAVTSGGQTLYQGHLFFFIPLKNDGFLLQQSSNRLSKTETYTSTGKFYTLKDTYNFDNDYIYDQNVTSGLICINPNLSTLSLSNYIYIPYGSTGGTGQPSGRTKNFQSYKPRIIIENQDIPITGLDIDQKYYDNYNINAASPTEPNYFIDYSIQNRFTNVSKNTCVLIKTPYHNEFIDNMYLFSTMPEEDMEGKFFSFNGRNFLCVFKNFVVELAN